MDVYIYVSMYVPYDQEKMSLEAELYDLTLKKIELELCVTIMCRNDELSWLFTNRESATR